MRSYQRAVLAPGVLDLGWKLRLRMQVLPKPNLLQPMCGLLRWTRQLCDLSFIAMTTLLSCFVLTLACSSRTAQDFGIVEFRRSGGVAGLDDHLTISPDGTAKLRRRAIRRELKIDAQVLDQLRKSVESARFHQLKNEYLPPQVGADLIEYTIKLDGRTVRTEDTAIPESLQPLIDLLVGIVEQ